MSSFDRLSHFKSIFDNFLHRPNFLKYPKIDVLGPDRGNITIYGSNFQQVNLTGTGEYLLLFMMIYCAILILATDFGELD